MNIFLDGLSILADHWHSVLGILLVCLLGCGIASLALKRIFENGLSPAEYFSLGMAGWILPVFIGIFLVLAGRVFSAAAVGLLIMLIIMAAGGGPSRSEAKGGAAQGTNTALPALVLIFLVSLVIRLAFISETILPLYFDSAEHYRIIQSLLDVYRSSQPLLSIPWPVSNYYHLGFHLLAALLTSALGADIKNVILDLGQILLAVMPISVFFIVRKETGSDGAGLLAVLLAGFGWYMPAHAVNWGKYPALLSLVTIQFVLCLAYAAFRLRNGLARTAGLFAMLGMGIFISTLAHTRSIVVIGLAFLSWIIAKWWCSSSARIKTLALCPILAVLLLEVMLVRSIDLLRPALDPYAGRGLWVTSAIMLASIFAFKAFPRLAFSSLLAISLFLACLFIPVPGRVPGYGYLTLLDRPFVEMLLYLPLSLVGGLGYAGLRQVLLPVEQKHRVFRQGVRFSSGIAAGLILLNAFFHYNFYPSGCCRMVSRDDLVAFDRLDKTLPLDSRILIPSAELNVLASDEPEGYTGTDAGVWITPLIKRRTLSLSNTTDFGQQDILKLLCRQRIGYIYLGGTQASFDDVGLRDHPEWYRLILFLPDASVYKVIECT